MTSLWPNDKPRISHPARPTQQVRGSGVSAFERELGNFELAIRVDVEIKHFDVDNNSH
ncbi:MAG: hypothetical protein H6R16_1791 [Proteobacteria bacterium]|nr:hypothetical protein [Pseudomonadota bacterium]